MKKAKNLQHRKIQWDFSVTDLKYVLCQNCAWAIYPGLFTFQDSFVQLLNMVQAQPWVGLTNKSPFKCKSAGCLSPPQQKPCVPVLGLLPCPPVVPVEYWTW